MQLQNDHYNYSDHRSNRLSKGCVVVCVWSENLRRLIALEVSSRGQRLRGAITTKQGTITLSCLNVAYNVDRADRQPVARYLRLCVSLARTDCRTTSCVLTFRTVHVNSHVHLPKHNGQCVNLILFQTNALINIYLEKKLIFKYIKFLMIATLNWTKRGRRK